MERLDKLLAATGQWSRKEAKALVKAGRVQVGGARPKGPEDKVAEGNPVTVDGRPIATEQGVYVMLHKPAGVVSSTQDPRERTVLPASAAAGAVSRGAAGQGHRGAAPAHQ